MADGRGQTAEGKIADEEGSDSLIYYLLPYAVRLLPCLIYNLKRK